MKNWIKIRKNQLSVILIATVVITISNGIIPAYETLAYYQGKMGSLENQHRQLHRYSLHIDYHEDRSNQIRQQLTELNQLYSDFRDSTFLQKHFGNIQRQCQLKVITQQINRSEISGDLEKINIQQDDGKFPAMPAASFQFQFKGGFNVPAVKDFCQTVRDRDVFQFFCLLAKLFMGNGDLFVQPGQIPVPQYHEDQNNTESGQKFPQKAIVRFVFQFTAQPFLGDRVQFILT